MHASYQKNSFYIFNRIRKKNLKTYVKKEFENKLNHGTSPNLKKPSAFIYNTVVYTVEAGDLYQSCKEYEGDIFRAAAVAGLRPLDRLLERQ